MRILLLGSGGREHALAWKINQSVWTNPLYIAPGNPGTAQCGKNVPLDISDFNAIEKIYFIGPSKKGAQLEGSKAFAKAFMKRHNIPTAKYREFDASNFEEGVHYVKEHALPVVLKADGLAAGKGVIICQTSVEAVSEFELMIQKAKFGEASKKVVVEEFLNGMELSVFVITDGKNYLLLPEAKDYKQVGERDTGLNTGGMGAVSPVPFATPGFMHKVEERIIKPTIAGLHKEEIDYKGFLFFGLISINGEPFVIEYNCRMGDPETEVVIPRLETDLVGLLVAATQQELNTVKLRVDERSAVTVMAVSYGYPGAYEKGFAIKGLSKKADKNSFIFHAGTKQTDGKILTNGGRVLCVTAYGKNIGEAVDYSLEILEAIDFDGIYYRTDIGYEFK